MGFIPLIKAKDPHFCVKELNRGNQSSIATIFNLYYAKVCHYVFSLVDSHELAEEIADNAFIKLWQTKDRKPFLDSNHVKAFLFVVARNNAFSVLKKGSTDRQKGKEYHYLQVDDSMASFSELKDSELLWVDVISELYEAINKLAPVQRSVILLYRKGLSTNEIASQLKKTPRGVRNTRDIAIKKLQKKLSHISLSILLLSMPIEHISSPKTAFPKDSSGRLAREAAQSQK